MSEPGAVPMALLVDARGVTAGYSTPLLSGIDLQLRAGESWFVVGRNGSGKSTLLATLLGVLKPLAGDVSHAAAIGDRSGIGYVAQDLAFAWPLPCTVAEFVDLGAQAGVRRHTRRANTANALACLGLTEFARRDVRELSVGQRRRVAVARALARAPNLLVLDEPVAHVDAAIAAELVRELDALRATSRVCIVHATHDLGLVPRWASHVAIVANGRVLAAPRAVALASDAWSTLATPQAPAGVWR